MLVGDITIKIIRKLCCFRKMDKKLCQCWWPCTL